MDFLTAQIEEDGVESTVEIVVHLIKKYQIFCFFNYQIIQIILPFSICRRTSQRQELYMVSIDPCKYKT